MAFVELSPIRKAHCVTSGEIPICANIGMKIKDINAHLEVADTIIRLINAVNKINKISADKGPGSKKKAGQLP